MKLQLYRQASVALRKQLKLSAKYYGLYEIVQKVGAVAYKLVSSLGSIIHPVFHVSLLKKKIGSKYFPSTTLLKVEEGVYKIYPIVILARRRIPKIM